MVWLKEESTSAWSNTMFRLMTGGVCRMEFVVVAVAIEFSDIFCLFFEGDFPLMAAILFICFCRLSTEERFPMGL